MVKTIKGGGSELSADMQKIANKLKELLAGGKQLDIRIDEIKKKAGAPNVANSTVSAYINREKAKGNFKNLNITRFAGGLKVGVSKYDKNYNNSVKFKNFYDQNYDTPWKDIATSRTGNNIKANAYNAFVRNQELLKGAKGFNLTPEEMAKKLNIELSSLRAYESNPNVNTSSQFIKDNIKKIRTVANKETVVRYKDPGVNVFKKWNTLQDSPQISSAMVDNIKEYDKVFRKELKDTKKLPDIAEVIQKTSMSTPTTIANTEALYSRLLRGETFRSEINVAKDVVLGKKIIDQLAINSSNNARRTAFYNLALDNVDKLYPQESGTLKDFKINFRNELKKILGPGIKEVPFSVNEVIGLSTGESRAIQPFSVFVDVVETNINKNELKNYQGAFSTKVRKIQDLLSGNKPNKIEAEKIALSLDSDRKTLVDRLTKKGFTEAQIGELNLPDIKIGQTIDSKIYSPKTLKRYKEAGLDLPQFAKDKGFYVDVKKAKPFFDVSEQSFKNTLLKAARTNEGGVCQIFRAEGGRIGFAAGSSCVKQMQIAFDNDPVKLSQDINKLPYEEGPINKVKNAATGFLNFAKKGGKFGALAAVGAAGAGAVKTFMNDDPTTYLSNEDQQKNMLIDMVTGSLDNTPVEEAPIGDAYLPTLGAVTVAGTAAVAPSTIEAARSRRFGKTPSGITKTALKTLGRGLTATTTPLGLLATEPLYLAEQIQEGDSLGEIATNPFNYLGAAFAGPATEFATKGLKNSGIAKAMRLGISPGTLKTVSRRFGLPGLALSLGISGYETFDDYRNKRGFFSEE